MSKKKSKVVFIDTEQFDRNKLSFTNANFSRLADLVDAGQVRVVLTDVVVREVRRHILKAFSDARTTLSDKFGGLFRNIENVPKPPVIEDEYWATAEKEVMDKFDAWRGRLKVEVIPLKPELATVVFDWYFALDGPFDSRKRKSEFPDAFSIACVEEWARQRREHVYAVSKDEAFKVMSREHLPSSSLTRLETLPEFFALFPDPEVAAAIRQSLANFLDDESNFQFGERAFQQLDFYVDVDDDESLEVEHVFVAWTDPRHRMHVVEAQHGKATLVGDLYVTFFAEISGIRDPIEETAFVDAEISLEYSEKDPTQISAVSVNYDGASAIRVALPSSIRRQNTT